MIVIRSRAGAAGLLIVLALTGTARPASAHVTTAGTRVTLGAENVGRVSGEKTRWYGFADSKRPNCEIARKVKVWRKDVAPDPLIGSATTGPFAHPSRWQFTTDTYPPPDGTYYATTRPKVLRDDENHRHVCARDTSEDLAVPGPNIDWDADGYYTFQGDCDDFDPAVHPFAPEVANGTDDDCDGETDEGTET